MQSSLSIKFEYDLHRIHKSTLQMEWCKNPKMHKYPSRDGLEFISREGGLLDLWDIFLRILKIHNGLIIIPTDPLPFQLYVCVSCRQNSTCLKGKILMTSQPKSMPAASILLYITAFLAVADAQLSSNFYSSSCPTALSIIKGAVSTAVSKEARMGASLLRLHFHDCFVNGCDGSILLDDTTGFTGEKTALPNANSVRGFDVIDTIKSQLESKCPGVVSCADILAVAARDSVVALGGTTWTVQLGRRDSTTASLSAANSDLPSPLNDLSSLITAFSNKGFTAKEMVALSGSHTIGRARCSTFRTHIYNETNIDASYASSLQKNCPSAGGDSNLANLDTVTGDVFDNNYFRNLVNKKGLLHSDQELFNGGSTDSQVTAYSQNSATFFTDFGKAMVKMGNLSPLTGSSGEVRTNCRKVNGS